MTFRILIFILFFSNKISFAQNIQLQGEVGSFENNEPLSYVNIGIANKTIGTVSNRSGLFTLTLNQQVTHNDTVVFFYRF